jgi:gamma-glutamyl phosphate reductase
MDLVENNKANPVKEFSSNKREKPEEAGKSKQKGILDEAVDLDSKEQEEESEEELPVNEYGLIILQQSAEDIDKQYSDEQLEELFDELALQRERIVASIDALSLQQTEEEDDPLDTFMKDVTHTVQVGVYI